MYSVQKIVEHVTIMEIVYVMMDGVGVIVVHQYVLRTAVVLEATATVQESVHAILPGWGTTVTRNCVANAATKVVIVKTVLVPVTVAILEGAVK